MDDLTMCCHTRKTKISRKSQKCVMFKCYVTWCFTINHDNICTKKKHFKKKKFFLIFIKLCQKHVFKHDVFLRFSGALLWLLVDFYWLLSDFRSHSRVTEKSTKSQLFIHKSQQKVNFEMIILKSQLQGVKQGKSWLFLFEYI